jgi:hypothetical protein
VVTFEEFLQVMTQLGGKGPAEVRRQGMALATLAVAGNEDLADRIMERSEEMTTEEQQFFQGAQTPTKEEKDGTSILGKRSRSPEEIEMNRQNAIQRREQRVIRNLLHTQQMQIQTQQMQLKFLQDMLKYAGILPGGASTAVTPATSPVNWRARPHDEQPEPANAVSVSQVIRDMNAQYLFGIDNAVREIGKSVASAYRMRFGRRPAKRPLENSQFPWVNVYDGNDAEVMELILSTIRTKCSEMGWEE